MADETDRPGAADRPEGSPRRAADESPADESPADESGTASEDAAPAPAREAVPAVRGAGLWLKIVLFAVGVAVGVVTMGLLNVTTPDFGAQRGGGGPLPSGASPSGGGAGVEARVNAACLAVINDAQDVYAVLGDLGPALDANDLMALDDIVRRLQPVEPRLAADLSGCRIDTTVGGGSGQTPAPGGTPTGPTASSSPVVPPPVQPGTPAPSEVVPTTSGPTAPPSEPAVPPGEVPGSGEPG